MARVLIDRSETGSHPVPLATESLTAYRLVDDRSPLGVIRVAPTGSKASPNVRYAFNGDRICASRRTDAMCHEQTNGPQQNSIFRRHPAEGAPENLSV